jgi:hypothetical protein
VPAGWVTADEVYGGSPALRGWLEWSCPGLDSAGEFTIAMSR